MNTEGMMPQDEDYEDYNDKIYIGKLYSMRPETELLQFTNHSQTQ